MPPYPERPPYCVYYYIITRIWLLLYWENRCYRNQLKLTPVKAGVVLQAPLWEMKIVPLYVLRDIANGTLRVLALVQLLREADVTQVVILVFLHRCSDLKWTCWLGLLIFIANNALSARRPMAADTLSGRDCIWLPTRLTEATAYTAGWARLREIWLTANIRLKSYFNG